MKRMAWIGVLPCLGGLTLLALMGGCSRGADPNHTLVAEDDSGPLTASDAVAGGAGAGARSGDESDELTRRAPDASQMLPPALNEPSPPRASVEPVRERLRARPVPEPPRDEPVPLEAALPAEAGVGVGGPPLPRTLQSLGNALRKGFDEALERRAGK